MFTRIIKDLRSRFIFIKILEIFKLLFCEENCQLLPLSIPFADKFKLLHGHLS